MNERTLTLYFTDDEYTTYKRIAQTHNMKWSEFVRHAVLRGHTIPTQKAIQPVAKLEDRRPHVVNVSKEVHAECRRGSKARKKTMSGYATWCLRNAGLISWHAPSTPVPSKQPGHGVRELVAQMTLNELAERTGTSVKQIVEWAMGSDPPGDEQPKESHLRAVS